MKASEVADTASVTSDVHQAAVPSCAIAAKEKLPSKMLPFGQANNHCFASILACARHWTYKTSVLTMVCRFAYQADNVSQSVQPLINPASWLSAVGQRHMRAEMRGVQKFAIAPCSL